MKKYIPYIVTAENIELPCDVCDTKDAAKANLEWNLEVIRDNCPEIIVVETYIEEV